MLSIAETHVEGREGMLWSYTYITPIEGNKKRTEGDEKEKERLTQRRRCVVPALGVVLVDVEFCRLKKITDNAI